MANPERYPTCERCAGAGTYLDPRTGMKRMANCPECGGAGHVTSTPPAPVGSPETIRFAFYTETTTDGRTLAYVATGPSTGDVEVVEIKPDEPAPPFPVGAGLREWARRNKP